MSKAHKALTKADYRHLAEFRYLLRQFLAFSEAAARASGLAPQQHQALLTICGAGGTLTVGELAARLVIKPHSAVGLADRLVDAGLVTRMAGANDRRQVALSLTAAANRKLAQLSAAHRRELEKLAPRLAPLLKQWAKG